jgi:DNA-binding transcriptional MocR family regulator
MAALKWAREPRPGLGGPATAVLRDLADHASESGSCWPAVATMAAETGLSRRTVQRALRRLEAAGLISVRPTGRGSLYVLALPRKANPQVVSRCQSDASEASESHLRGVRVTPKALRSQKKPYARARARSKAGAKAPVNPRRAGAVPACPAPPARGPSVQVDEFLLRQAHAWLAAHPPQRMLL